LTYFSYRGIIRVSKTKGGNKMARLIAHKTLDKMVNYETGKWRFYKGVDHRNVNEIIKKLEEQEIQFKHYYVSTRIAGIYDPVIIVKK
jgi:hypothetical protein